MPTYLFENKKTGEQISKFCSYVEAKEFESEGNWKMLLSAPLIVSGIGTTITSKIDGGFNDVLGRMKNFYRNSKIDTK